MINLGPRASRFPTDYVDLQLAASTLRLNLTSNQLDEMDEKGKQLRLKLDTGNCDPTLRYFKFAVDTALVNEDVKPAFDKTTLWDDKIMEYKYNYELYPDENWFVTYTLSAEKKVYFAIFTSVKNSNDAKSAGETLGYIPFQLSESDWPDMQLSDMKLYGNARKLSRSVLRSIEKIFDAASFGRKKRKAEGGDSTPHSTRSTPSVSPHRHRRRVQSSSTGDDTDVLNAQEVIRNLQRLSQIGARSGSGIPDGSDISGGGEHH